MTKIRLNVWYRLGIALTVLWLIGGTITFHVMTMNQRFDFAESLEKFCLDGFDNLQKQYPRTDYTKEHDDCITRSTEYLNSETPTSHVLWASFLVSSGMALAAWMLVGLTLVVVRWILAGRSKTSAR